jgi:hypothetical protein
MSRLLIDASYLLIAASAAVGGLVAACALLLRRKAPHERDKLYPVSPTPLRPLNTTRWAELANELGCTTDELTDYSQRIAQFIVRELRWGGTFVLERQHGRPLILMFDRFEPIFGTDIPPAPMPPDPLLPASQPELQTASHGASQRP